ncbi:transketolase family protein [Actinorhabdospora filicis]|nr:transketolase [Actinorhabdospora filicis]
MRDVFLDTTAALIDENPRVALVLADISSGVPQVVRAAKAHPDRVINVGIREALMVGTGGGLAIAGLRPIVHSYAPFLVERAYEQIKLDFEHQGVGGILVSIGASYDRAAAGYTHFSPADVSLFDNLPGEWIVHVPGHPGEVEGPLREAAATDDRVYMRLSIAANGVPRETGGKLLPVKDGDGPLVIAVGSTLDAVLAAAEGTGWRVAYANTVRPFDTEGLRAMAGRDVVIVEPYHEGTSAHVLSEALADRPHRLLSIGVKRVDLHLYGSAADHDRHHGLDAASLSARIGAFAR